MVRVGSDLWSLVEAIHKCTGSNPVEDATPGRTCQPGEEECPCQIANFRGRGMTTSEEGRGDVPRYSATENTT
ncbi:Hypp6048 [Branchiostoma lanceolatum]|uniref:Hypp6048 protein n=1 Tax=Branchiostoma lanceolatum TaxID=7740 RepID=A0A8J9VIE8_BRALA|nr:Hypp6048 [Branchiostoma lanceolatum]